MTLAERGFFVDEGHLRDKLVGPDFAEPDVGAGDVPENRNAPAQNVVHADADLAFADHDFVRRISAGDGGVGEFAEKLFVEAGKHFDFLNDFSHEARDLNQNEAGQALKANLTEVYLPSVNFSPAALQSVEQSHTLVHPEHGGLRLFAGGRLRCRRGW